MIIRVAVAAAAADWPVLSVTGNRDRRPPGKSAGDSDMHCRDSDIDAAVMDFESPALRCRTPAAGRRRRRAGPGSAGEALIPAGARQCHGASGPPVASKI
jgi:hypothetical protein